MTRHLTIPGAAPIYRRIIETRDYEGLQKEAANFNTVRYRHGKAAWDFHGEIIVRRPVEAHTPLEVVISAKDTQRNRILINAMVEKFDVGS